MSKNYTRTSKLEYAVKVVDIHGQESLIGDQTLRSAQILASHYNSAESLFEEDRIHAVVVSRIRIIDVYTSEWH